MPFWSVIAKAIFRLFLVLSPFIGVLNRDIDNFNLGGAHLEEARELMEVVNARIILVSWSILLLVDVFARSEILCEGVEAFLIMLLVTITGFASFVFYRLPTRILRGIAPPLIIAIGTIVLDVAFQWWALDFVTLKLCSALAPPNISMLSLMSVP